MPRHRRRSRPPTPPGRRAAPLEASTTAEPSGDSLREAVRAALEAKTGIPAEAAGSGTGSSAAGGSGRVPLPGRDPSTGPAPGRVGGASGAGRGFRPLPRRTG